MFYSLEEENKMNLANKLTIFRMILVPVMVLVSLIGIPGQLLEIDITFWVMNLIFIIASITDHLDGHIARSRNQITTFGKFLDPLADKILVVTAMILLVELGNLPGWIPIIVIAREFLVSAYRLIALQKQGNVIAASIWGKIKTATQMFAIIGAFLNINGTNMFGACFSGELAGIEFYINLITTLLFIFSTIATVFSGWDYMKHGKKLLKEEQESS